jgi:hypothetical protein
LETFNAKGILIQRHKAKLLFIHCMASKTSAIAQFIIYEFFVSGFA